MYREEEEGYAEDDVKMGVGSVFHVANETEDQDAAWQKGRSCLIHDWWKWRMVLDAQDRICAIDGAARHQESNWHSPQALVIGSS